MLKNNQYSKKGFLEGCCVLHLFCVPNAMRDFFLAPQWSTVVFGGGFCV